jgi:hypothetical protein
VAPPKAARPASAETVSEPREVRLAGELDNHLPTEAKSHTQAHVSQWRSTYKVHPAADVFPMMDDTELQKLSDDINANGLKHFQPTRIAGPKLRTNPKYGGSMLPAGTTSTSSASATQPSKTPSSTSQSPRLRKR